MASHELIQKFQNENNVQINVTGIKNTLERLLTQHTDQKTREARIKNFVIQSYPEIAREFEQKKMFNSLYHSAEPSKMNAVEFFDGYMNIISAMAQEASDSLVELSKEEQEKAEIAEKEARALLNEKETKLENLRNNYLAKHGELESLEATGAYKKDYKDPVDFAKIAVTNAEEKKKAIVPAVPFKSEKVYFGISADEAKTMLEAQVKTTNYANERRAQMESVGVRFAGYMTDLQEAFKDKDVKYQSATAEQKRAMQEVHTTKKLMQEQLDSKTSGIFGWFRRWWYRKDISAITSYISAADKAFENAGFGEAEAKEADDAMAKNDFFYNRYKASDLYKALDEKLAENKIVNEPENVNKEEIVVQNKEEKEAAPAQKNEETEKTQILNQFFAKEFRPSTSRKTLVAQAEALKTINAIINKDKSKQFPKDVIHVLNANSLKMREYQKLLKAAKTEGAQVLAKAVPTFKAIEERLDNSVTDYKPITFEEFKAIAASLKDKEVVDEKPDVVATNENVEKTESVKSVEKQALVVDLSNPDETKELSQPITYNEPSLSKDNTLSN